MKNWAPLLAALALTGCGAVAGAQGLTHRSISGALEVPASCEHPATVMKGNEKTWKPGSNDSPPGNTRLERDRAAFGDITGDGSSEAIVPMMCNAGGVAWPYWLLIYGHNGELLGAVDTAKIENPQEHSLIEHLRVENGDVRFDLSTFVGAGTSLEKYQATVAWTKGKPELTLSAGESSGG
ncbi:MAG: hypothetical protein V9E81_15345 [Marmoricola sp.]